MFNIDLGNKKNKIAKLSTIADEDIPMTVDEDTTTVQRIVYFANNAASPSFETVRQISLSQYSLDWACAKSWSELGQEIDIGTKLILVHVDMLLKSPCSSATEFMDALTAVIKSTPDKEKIKVGVVITKYTPVSLIKELQATCCQGLLLDSNHYPVDHVMMGINAFVNCIPYWPKTVIEHLPKEQLLYVYSRARQHAPEMTV